MDKLVLIKCLINKRAQLDLKISNNIERKRYTVKMENPQALLGNHQTIYLDKTNFFYILKQLIEDGSEAEFIYDNNVPRENLEIVSKVPPTRIVNKLYSAIENATGVQLNLKDGGYIILDANICFAESVSRSLIIGYRVNIDCSFGRNLDEPDVCFSFDDLKIQINGIDGDKFNTIINGLPDTKK